MSTQASLIFKFHDDPELCHDLERNVCCNYFAGGHCVLRVVGEGSIGLYKFLKLEKEGKKTFKDPSCKFIWEKNKR